MSVLRIALAIVVFACTAGCDLALGTTGSWTPGHVPPQVIPQGASIVALSGGRVAVFGGFVTTTGAAASETLLFDSATGQWSSSPPIPEPQIIPTVVALGDGSVLVAGGETGYTSFNPGAPLASAWILDPTARSWRRTGDMINPRRGANGALLSDGRVLIVGGTVPAPSSDAGPQVQNVKTAEIFDPRTGAWAPAGVLDRDGGVLIPLPGGKAVAAGGCQFQSQQSLTPTGQQLGIANADEFDGTKWIPLRPMPSARCAAKGVGLPDGRALVLGGFDASGTPQEALTFDPRNGSWTSAGGPSISGNPEVAMLADGRVYVPDIEPGPRQQGRSTLLLGGQLFDSRTNGWTFVTTTSLVTGSQFGNPQVAGLASLPPDGALVILENAVMSFDANRAPPPVSVLDSIGLTYRLLALVGLLVVVFLAAAQWRHAGSRGSASID